MDYSATWWRAWRVWYISLLVDLGLVPTCGAMHPDGPQAHGLSQCQAQGYQTPASMDGSSLHLHHEPELTEAEQRAIRDGDHAIACDMTRIVLLCRTCHSAVTMTGRRAA